MIFANDHEPPHVHVVKAGTEAVIELVPVAIRDNYRMSRAYLRQAVDLVAENQRLLVEAWRDMHEPE